MHQTGHWMNKWMSEWMDLLLQNIGNVNLAYYGTLRKLNIDLPQLNHGLKFVLNLYTMLLN